LISQNTIQQITGRIDIIDVVGGFVKLKKRGSNYLGLCPFHNERNPFVHLSLLQRKYISALVVAKAATLSAF
jgi:DNA primase